MSELIKKSIFVESIMKYEPHFFVMVGHSSYYNNERYYQSCFKTEHPIKDNNIVRTIDIPTPLLAIGDEFYFEDTSETVKIEKVMRTSADNVVYVINTKMVANEEAMEMYKKNCKEFLDKELLNKRIKELESEIARLQNRKLWDRIKNKCE